MAIANIHEISKTLKAGGLAVEVTEVSSMPAMLSHRASL
jgi:hypothetical protein